MLNKSGEICQIQICNKGDSESEVLVGCSFEDVLSQNVKCNEFMTEF